MPALPVVVLGAGGHGKVVADILTEMGRRPVGFLDPKKPAGTTVLGLPVLGDDDWLLANQVEVALGMGDNAMRERLALRALERGTPLATAVHPRAVVARSATIADGVVIAALAVVNPDASVERGAIINTGAIVEHDCIIGEFAHLATNATTGGACRIGRLSLLGSGATMLPETVVGDETRVGAHALVTRDLPAHATARGVPARLTARRD
ncbi:MAG: acetyltransferase [Labilithrix sp.]|nr:acetyltransferase [Labilithrix sp.]